MAGQIKAFCFDFALYGQHRKEYCLLFWQRCDWNAICIYPYNIYYEPAHNGHFAIAFVPPYGIAHHAGNRWIERQPNARYSPYKLVYSIFSICSSVLCCICATFHPQHRNQFCVVVKIPALNSPNLLPFIAIHACSHSFAIPKYSHFMFYSSQSNCDNDNTLANIIFLSPGDSPISNTYIKRIFWLLFSSFLSHPRVF